MALQTQVDPGREQAQARKLARFERDEWPRLAALFGFVILLHVIGFGLFFHYNAIAKFHDLQGCGDQQRTHLRHRRSGRLRVRPAACVRRGPHRSHRRHHPLPAAEGQAVRSASASSSPSATPAS